MLRKILSRPLALPTFVALVVFFIHIALLVAKGPLLSNDYRQYYKPLAEVLFGFLSGDKSLGDVITALQSTFNIFYILYSAFIGLCARLDLSETVIVLIQIVTVALSVGIIQYYLGKLSGSPIVTSVVLISSHLLIDNSIWTIWIVPNGPFKAFFCAAYVYLVNLLVTQRYSKFVILTFAFMIPLQFLRPDTGLMSVGLFWACGSIMFEKSKKLHRGIRVGMLTLVSVIFMILLFSVRSLVESLHETLLDSYKEGWVVVSGYQLDPVANITDQSIAFHLLRTSKLLGLRFFEFLNPWPPFFSMSHKITYAIFTIPTYLLSLYAIFHFQKTKKFKVILLLFTAYIGSMIIHGALFVETSLRTLFAARMMLAMTAVFGVAGLIERFGLGARKIETDPDKIDALRCARS